MAEVGEGLFDDALFPDRVILNGGYAVRQLVLDDYWIDFNRAGDALVITFENAGDGVGDGRTRDYWGAGFLGKRGYSVIGVKWKKKNWYRGKSLAQFFASEAFKKFATGFSATTFMGGSMGGYAALAFSSSIPGSVVLAHNPQSTLDQRLVPWDSRFPEALDANWDGDFADGAVECISAKQVFVTYDPFHMHDRRQVERISAGNLIRLSVPFVGHQVPVWLKDMKILSHVTDLVLRNELTTAEFARLVRARRSLPRYYARLLSQSRHTRHRELVLEKAFQRVGPNAELVAAAIRNLSRTGESARCITLYKSQGGELARARGPGMGVARALVGLAMIQSGGAHPELEEICAAINLKTRFVEELAYSAWLLLESGRLEAAYALACRSVDAPLSKRIAFKVKALCEMKMGRLEEALQTIDKGLELFGAGDDLLRLKGATAARLSSLTHPIAV